MARRWELWLMRRLGMLSAEEYTQLAPRCDSAAVIPDISAGKPRSDGPRPVDLGDDPDGDVAGYDGGFGEAGARAGAEFSAQVASCKNHRSYAHCPHCLAEYVIPNGFVLVSEADVAELTALRDAI